MKFGSYYGDYDRSTIIHRIEREYFFRPAQNPKYENQLRKVQKMKRTYFLFDAIALNRRVVANEEDLCLIEQFKYLIL